MALDYGKLNFSTSFNPTSAFPLDARSYFESYELAVAAAATAVEPGTAEASNTVYYYGETIVVNDGDSAVLYTIQPNKTLQEVGTAGSGDEKSIVVENGKIAINDFGKNYWKYVAKSGETEAHYEYVTGSFKEGLIPHVYKRKVAGVDTLKLEWYEQDPTAVYDANYKHITVTTTSVSDGTNTFNQYDDTEITERIATEEDRAVTAEGALEERIENLEAKGRFLSGWNMGTGKPTTDPSSLPYTYKSGDYYIVDVVPETGNKYQPSGSSYTGAASTTVETREVFASDYYTYDGTKWVLISNSQKTVTFKNITGEPTENTKLAAALNSKVDKEEGKSLISNSDITKLAGIAAGAQVNIIEKVKLNGSDLAIDSEKRVDLGSLISQTTFDALAGRVTTAEASISALQATVGDSTSGLVKGLADEITRAKAKENEIVVLVGDETTRAQGVEALLQADIDNRVEKVEGMGLSHNDFTDALLTKLNSVESGAQKNIIESIMINGSALVIENKSVTIPMAMTGVLGVVKGSASENKISVDDSGEMEVNSLNVNKLTQTAGDTLTIDGGSSNN